MHRALYLAHEDDEDSRLWWIPDDLNHRQKYPPDLDLDLDEEPDPDDDPTTRFTPHTPKGTQ
jgi:hypothetical protein